MYKQATGTEGCSFSTKVIVHCCCLFLMFTPMATTLTMAAPIEDPRAPVEFKPTVNIAENGSAIVNITAPSQAGISLNKFKQFDVEQAGLVLNNSLVDGSSNLAGFLAANPNLSGQSANMIVNEVTGTNLSTLLGDIEVFGDKASIIIANPYGISCNGCGFINTDSVALTTGRPILTGGDIQLDIKSSGTVTVEEGGLNGDVSALKLIAGNISLQGTVVVLGDLTLAAGDMLYDYGSNSVVESRSNSTQSRYAIDGSLLGAMRAGSINIIVEGKNAGVRLEGYAEASQGDFDLSADGNISLRGLASAGAINIQSQGDVTQAKDFTAGRDITITAANLSVAEDGALQTAESLNVTLTGSATIFGDTQVRDSVNITAVEGITLGEEFLVSGGAQLNTQGSVILSEGIFSVPTLSINAESTRTTNGATLQLGQSIIIDGGTVQFDDGSYIVADESVQLLNNSNFNNAGQIVTQHLSANGAVGSNAENAVIQTEQLGLEFSERFSNSGNIISGAFEFIRTPLFENLASGRISVSAIDVDGFFNNQGAVIYDGNLSLSASTGLTSGGTLVSTGLMDISTAGALSLSGSIQALSGLDIQSSGPIQIQNLDLVSQGDWHIVAGSEQLSINGLNAYVNAIDWQAQSVDLNGVVNLAASDVNIELLGDFTNLGQLTGFDALALSAVNVVNAGLIESAGQISINSQAFDNSGQLKVNHLILDSNTFANSGVLQSNNFDLTLENILNNAAGEIRISDTFNLQSLGIDNQAGLILASHFNATLFGDILNHGGEIQAVDTLNLSGNGQIDNTLGLIIGGAALSLTGFDNIDNQQGWIQTQGAITLAANSLNNTSGVVSLNSGSITLSGNLDNTTGEIRGVSYQLNAENYHSDTASMLFASDQLTININSALNNEGILLANGSLLIDTENLNNNGLIYANDMTVLAGTQLSNQGRLQAANLSVETSELLNGAGAQILASEILSLQATQLLQNEGLLTAFDTLSINTSELNNNGVIGAVQLPVVIGYQAFQGSEDRLVSNLDITADNISNSGNILALEQASFTVNNELINDGQIYADQLSIFGAGQTINTGDILAQSLSLELTALVNHNLIQTSDFTATVTEFINTDDALTIVDDASFNITNALTNSGIIYANNTISLEAQSLTNSGTVSAAQLLASLTGGANNSGNILMGDSASSISAAQIQNTATGIIKSADELALDAQSLDNAGLINSATALLLSGVDINNAAGGSIISTGRIDGLALSGDINNAGRIAAGDFATKTGLLQLAGRQLNNQAGGLIYSANDLLLNFSAGILNQGPNAQVNAAATIYAENNATFNSQDLNNAGDIGSNTLISEHSGAVSNSGLINSQTLVLKAHSLINSGRFSSVEDSRLEITTALENSGDLIAEGRLVLSSASLNNAGNVSAQQLQSTHSADVINSGAIITLQQLNINAASIENLSSGLIQSSTDINLLSQADLDNQGTVLAGGTLDIAAANVFQTGLIRAADAEFTITDQLDNTGHIYIASAWLTAGTGVGQLNINASAINNSGLLYGETINIAAEDLNNINGLVSAESTLDIQLTGDLFNRHGLGLGGIQSAGDLQITAASILNQGDLIAQQSLMLTAVQLNNQGLIQTSQNLAVNISAELHNSGSIIALEQIDLSAGELLINGSTTSAAFLQAAQLNIDAAIIEINESAVVRATDTVNIVNVQRLSNAGLIQAGSTYLTATGAQSLFENSGALVVEQFSVSQLQRYSSQGGVIDSAGAVVLDVTDAANSALEFSAGAQLISRNGSIDLAADIISNRDSLINSAGALSITTDTYENHGSAYLAGSQVTLDIRKLINSGALGGELIGGAGLREVVNDGGRIDADGISWSLDSLSNIGGLIVSTGDINITTGFLNNQAGEFYAIGAAIDLLVSGQFSNSGKVIAESGLSVNAQTLDNTGLLSAGTMSLFAQTINQNGQLLSTGSASLQAQQGLSFGQGSSTQVGSLSASGTSITNLGSIQSQGSAIFNTAGDVINRADIISGGVVINAANIVNAGLMSSSGQDTFTATQLLNSGFIYSGQAQFSLSQQLYNSGVISGSGSVDVNTQRVNNSGGYLAGGSLSVTALDQVDNSGGTLLTHNGALSINTNELVLANLKTSKNISELETIDLVSASDSSQASLIGDIANQLETDLAAATDAAAKDALIAAAASAIGGQLPGMTEAEQSALTMLLSQQGDNPDNSIEIVRQSMLYANGELNVTVAQDLSIEGDVFAYGNTAINVAGGLEQQGRLVSLGNLQLNIDGDFASDRSSLSTLSAAGDVFVGADNQPINDQVYTASLANITLSGADLIELNNSALQAAGNITIRDSATAELNLVGDKARLFTAGLLDIRDGIESINISDTNALNNWEVRGADIKLSADFNNAGLIKSSGTIKLDIDGDLNLAAGSMLHANVLDLSLNNGFDYTSPGFKADSALTLRLPSFNLASGNTLRVDGAIRIISSGDITNAGQIISRRRGIQLSGRNISNASSGHILAAGFIEAGASGYAQNSGSVLSFSSISWAGNQGSYNESSGGIYSKGSISLGHGSGNAINAGVLKAEGQVTLAASGIAGNGGVIDASSVLISGLSGGNSGTIYSSGVDGVTFTGLSQADIDASIEALEGGGGTVNPGSTGQTPSGLNATGESSLATLDESQRTDGSTPGAANGPSRVAANGPTLGPRVNHGALSISALQSANVSSTISDALLAQLGAGPVTGSLASGLTRPQGPSVLDLGALFADISINPMVDPNSEAAGANNSNPSPSADPDKLSLDDRIALVSQRVEISDDEFTAALHPNAPQHANGNLSNFWDGSALEQELASIQEQKIQAQQTAPSLEGFGGQNGGFGLGSIDLANFDRFFSADWLNDYGRDLLGFNPLANIQDGVGNTSGDPKITLTFDPNDPGAFDFSKLASSDAVGVMPDGTIVTGGTINASGHSRLVFDDEETLSDMASDTISFLQALPSPAAGGEKQAEPDQTAGGNVKNEAGMLSELGVDFGEEGETKLSLNGLSYNGRSLDNIVAVKDENGEVSLQVSEQLTGIGLGRVAGLFAANDEGNYIDDKGKELSADEFKAHIVDSNPSLFAGGQNTQLLEKALEDGLSLNHSGGLTVTGGTNAEGEYQKLSGDFINVGVINTTDVTVLANNIDLRENSVLNIANNFYADAKNDINLGTGNVQIGNNFIAKAGGDINLSAERQERQWQEGSTEFSEVQHKLASLEVGGNLLWQAEKDINLIGANLNIGGQGQIKAGNNINIKAVANEFSQTERRKNFEETTSSITHAQSGITTQNSLALLAANDLTIMGSTLSAGNAENAADVILAAGGNTTIGAVSDENYHYRYKKKKKSFGRSKTYINEEFATQNVASVVQATGAIDINRLAKEVEEGEDPELMDSGNVLVQGSVLAANDDITIVSTLGEVAFEAREELQSTFSRKLKKGFLGLSSSDRGSSSRETLLAGAQSIGGGKTSFQGESIRVIASSVVGEDTISMVSDGAITISAAAGEIKSQNWDKSKKFLSGGNLFDFAIHTDADDQEVVYESTIASNSGQVNIKASAVDIVGSTLVGQGLTQPLEDGNIKQLAGVNVLATTGAVNISAFETKGTGYVRDKTVKAGLGDVSGGSPVKNEDGQLKFVLGSAVYDSVKTDTRDTQIHGSNIISDSGVTIVAANDNVNIFGSNIVGDNDADGVGDAIVSAVNGSIVIAESKEESYKNTKETHGKGEVSFVVQHQAVEVAKALLALKEAKDQLGDAKDSLKEFNSQRDSLAQSLADMKAKKLNGEAGVSQQSIRDAEFILAEMDGDKSFYEAGVAAAALGVTQQGIAIAQQAAAGASSTVAFGFNAGIQVDASVEKKETTEQSTQSVGSSITGANVSLIASKDEGQSITIQGSDIISAQTGTTTLSAYDVNILASRDVSSSRMESQNASIHAQLTLFGATSGASLSGSYGQGMAKSSSIDYTNSNVLGGNLILDAANDVNIVGGTVRGEQSVVANIGGDLRIESVQNTSLTRSSDWGVSAGISLGGDGKADEVKKDSRGISSGDASTAVHGLNSSDINRVSGVNGGASTSSSNGFSRETVLSSLTSGGTADITVGGNTTLIGSVLATVDAAGNDLNNLNLSTGTFTIEDLSDMNFATSTSSGFSVNVGIAKDKAKPGDNGVHVKNKTTDTAQTTTVAQEGQQDVLSSTAEDGTKINSSQGNFSSSTEAGVSSVAATLGGGNIVIRDEDQEQALAGVNRDVSTTKIDHIEVDVSQDVAFKVDHRIFTEKGREDIGKDFDNLGGNLQKTFNNIPNAKVDNPILAVIGKGLDVLSDKTFGLTPSSKSHGGGLAQIPILFGSGDINHGAYLVLGADNALVLANPDDFVPVNEVEYYGDLQQPIKDELTGLMVSRYDVDVADYSTFQNFVNGQDNTLADAIGKAVLQNKATEFTIGFNPSHGGISDTIESGVDKLFYGNGLIPNIARKVGWTTGIARQTGEFLNNVVTARNTRGTNIVGHSQGAALINAGVILQLESGGLAILQDDIVGQQTKKRTFFFTNGSPINNLVMQATLDSVQINFSGSHVNTGDAVGGFLGANQGLYLNEHVENANTNGSTGSNYIESLGFIERIKAIGNPIILGGDGFPEYDKAGNQTNTVSPHGVYNCVVNCGNKSPWESEQPSIKGSSNNEASANEADSSL